MEPAINSGDSVLVNRFTYLVSAPKPGDVVVFKPNGNERSHYYMRRVIAEPGDKAVSYTHLYRTECEDEGSWRNFFS